MLLGGVKLRQDELRELRRRQEEQQKIVTKFDAVRQRVILTHHNIIYSWLIFRLCASAKARGVPTREEAKRR